MTEQSISSSMGRTSFRRNRREVLFENVLAYLFLAPVLIVIAGVLFYPILSLFRTSFYSPQTFYSPSEFIGFDNYRAVLDDAIFPTAVKNTFYWTFGVTLGQVIVGMYFALILHRHFPGRWLARMLVIIPWVLPGIVVAITWRFMYHQDLGLINNTLDAVGLDNWARSWLGRKETAMPAVIIVGIWKGFAFYTLMFLAGMQTIPNELYESARIDGAGARQQLFSITLPLLRPVALTSTVLGLIWTSNYFDAIFVLTHGGPARATETLPMYVYNTAFQHYRFEKGMAGSNILMAVVLIILVLYGLMLTRGNPMRQLGRRDKA